jgi:hypothetical protein
MSDAPETFRSSLVALESFLLDYPEEAVGTVILRSQDSYDFRVPKLYIIHSSPILREEILSSPNPQSAHSAISAEPDVEGTSNAHRVVQLPVYSTILISLLSYVFPVRPILPSTTDQIMELLSVAQMYKMDVVLTHIRNHIAQLQPPFIQNETAFFVYALAQKHGLRTEALQAARCTLSFSTMTIQGLANEGKLGLMPGASLHELWKYWQRVRSSFAVDIEEFSSSHRDELKAVEDLSCSDDGPPYWLSDSMSTLGRVPASDFADFHMGFIEHSRGLDSKYREACGTCLEISDEALRDLWEVLMVVRQGSITKVRTMHVPALVDRTEHGAQAEIEFALCDEGMKSENEVRARSSMEAFSLPKYRDMPNADVVLQSSDYVNFRVHRAILVTSSPFFRDMFSLPQPANDIAPDGLPVLRLSENAEVLNSLISMLYPVHPEMARSTDIILALLAATDKYDMGAIQSFIRAEVSREGLLSPTDSGGVFCMYAVACNKRLIPEMETAARLSLNYPLTFESLGEALRLFDGWALCGLAEFRLRCDRDLESRMISFLYSQDGPSKIWSGCPSVRDPQFPPPWLARPFSNLTHSNFKHLRFGNTVPTSAGILHEFLKALQYHINEMDCHFCMKTYTLKGEGYCAEMCEMLEQARNIPTQILGNSPGD